MRTLCIGRGRARRGEPFLGPCSSLIVRRPRHAASVRYGLTDAPSGGLTMVDPPLLSQ
jgi:hypothetical protein